MSPFSSIDQMTNRYAAAIRKLLGGPKGYRTTSSPLKAQGLERVVSPEWTANWITRRRDGIR